MLDLGDTTGRQSVNGDRAGPDKKPSRLRLNAPAAPVYWLVYGPNTALTRMASSESSSTNTR